MCGITDLKRRSFPIEVHFAVQFAELFETLQIDRYCDSSQAAFKALAEA